MVIVGTVLLATLLKEMSQRTAQLSALSKTTWTLLTAIDYYLHKCWSSRESMKRAQHHTMDLLCPYMQSKWYYHVYATNTFFCTRCGLAVMAAASYGKFWKMVRSFAVWLWMFRNEHFGNWKLLDGGHYALDAELAQIAEVVASVAWHHF